MGTIESALKAEMSRLAKREAKAMVEPLEKEIRRLNREIKSLQSGGGRAKASAPSRAGGAPALPVGDADTATARISPGLIKKLRKRIQVTQAQLAALVGVSPAAVQSWEQGIARPTGGNLAALVSLRKLSAAEVSGMLESKGIAAAKRRPRTEEGPRGGQPKTAEKAAKKTAKKTAKKKTKKKAKRSKAS